VPAAHSSSAPIALLARETLYVGLPEKQVKMVRVAYELIARKGLHQMTLQDVADAAKVSKANVVHHFKTKENLVLVTMRWVLGRVAERVDAAVLPSADDPEATIRTLVDVIFVDAKRNRDFYLAYTDLIANATRNPRFGELSSTFRAVMNDGYAQIIRAGAGEAFAVDDVDEAAMVVRGLIDGLFIQWLEEPQWRRLHARYKDLCYRAVLGYLRDGAARA
jgi:AcrR family transcriptional regulator